MSAEIAGKIGFNQATLLLHEVINNETKDLRTIASNTDFETPNLSLLIAKRRILSGSLSDADEKCILDSEDQFGLKQLLLSRVGEGQGES